MTDGIDKTGVSLSVGSSSTMIGFSAAIITIIASFWNNQQLTASFVSLFCFYILSITFFIFSTEFFILASWNDDYYHKLSSIGSIFYGLGIGWIILGLSMTFKILINSTMLAIFTLSSYLIGLIIYYLIRKSVVKELYINKLRNATRFFMFFQIVIGIFAVAIF